MLLIVFLIPLLILIAALSLVWIALSLALIPALTLIATLSLTLFAAWLVLIPVALTLSLSLALSRILTLLLSAIVLFVHRGSSEFANRKVSAINEQQSMMPPQFSTARSRDV